MFFCAIYVPLLFSFVLFLLQEKAKLLESCLDDLDKDKDDMLQVVKLELAKALRHAQVRSVLRNKRFFLL